MHSVCGPCFSPDGARIFYQTGRTSAREADLATGLRLRTFTRTDSAAPLNALAISGDGRHLAMGFWDGVLLVWRLTADGTRVLRRSRFGGTISHLRFAPDSKSLGVGGPSHLSLVDLETGRTVREFESSGLNCLDFSAEGNRIAISHGSNVQVFGLGDGTELTLKGHQKRVTGIRFDSTGNYLTAAGEDGTVRIWDTRHVDMVFEVILPGENSAAYGFDLHARENLIAVGYLSGAVALSRIDYDGHQATLLWARQAHTTASDA